MVTSTLYELDAPAGFIEPCLPSPADKPPSGSNGMRAWVWPSRESPIGLSNPIGVLYWNTAS